MFKLTRKKVGIGIAVGAVAISAPFAYSYWTQGGTGNGSAATGGTVDVEVNQTAFDLDDALYPGGDPITLAGDFNNDNDGPVYIDHVTVEVSKIWSSVAVDADLPACDWEDFAIGGSTGETPIGQIASGDGVGNWTGLTIKLINKTGENQDNCKNLTSVPLVYTANAFPADD